jgi:hypothetical protein
MSFIAAFFGYIYDILFGCHHSNVTRPFTLRKDDSKETYKVCLDCGRELAYSATTMKFVRRPILRPLPQTVTQPSLSIVPSARILAFKPVQNLQDSNAAA